MRDLLNQNGLSTQQYDWLSPVFGRQHLCSSVDPANSQNKLCEIKDVIGFSKPAGSAIMTRPFI
jgi:hypothetical protein